MRHRHRPVDLGYSRNRVGSVAIPHRRPSAMPIAVEDFEPMVDDASEGVVAVAVVFAMMLESMTTLVARDNRDKIRVVAEEDRKDGVRMMRMMMMVGMIKVHE